MIETEAQLRVTQQKVEELQESLKQDLTEVPSDVRDEVIRQRQVLIRELEEQVLDYCASKKSEDQFE